MPVGPYATFDECVSAVMAEQDVDEESARRICGAMEQDTNHDRAPMEVRRTFPFEIVKSEVRFEGDGLTFEGYAAVFDQATRISGWEGDFFETIRKGAFSKSIGERTPVLQFDHGMHPMVGSIPLGVITKINEDGRGLFVRARLSNNWLVEPVRDAIADGAIDGMSFRFNVVRDEWDMDTDPVPTRTLLEVRTPEVGPVVFPAYEGTAAGVRSSEANRIIEAIRQADEDTRHDLARMLTFPSISDAADTGTLEEDPGTPPLLAPAVVRAAAIRDRVMDELRRSVDRKEAINGGRHSGDRDGDPGHRRGTQDDG